MALRNERKMEESVNKPSHGLDRSLFRPQTKKAKSKGVAQLTLTSLVDCFTILVIYLLVATTIGGEEMNTPKGINLPLAVSSDSFQAGTTIAYAGGQYLVDEKPVSLQKLVETLEQNTNDKKEFLNIMADKSTDFEDLNAAVLAGLQAGFKQVRFVIKQKDDV